MVLELREVFDTACVADMAVIVTQHLIEGESAGEVERLFAEIGNPISGADRETNWDNRRSSPGPAS